MKRHLSDFLTAAAVLLCSGVLLGALAYALGGFSVRKEERLLQIDYPDVAGIRLHSEVRYAGAPAGTVVAVRLLTLAERNAAVGEPRRNAVRVSVALTPAVPPLPGDVKASLASETLLSEKFIALTAGSPEAPTLAAGIILQGETGGSIDGMIASLPPLLASVEKALAGIDPLLATAQETMLAVKGGINDLVPRVGKVADSAETTAASAQALIARMDKLIAENEGGIKTNLAELRETMVKMQDVLGTAEGFVGRTDKEVAGRMRELSVVLQNLKVVTTHAKTLTETLARQPHRLIFGGKPNRVVPEEEILRSGRPVSSPRR